MSKKRVAKPQEQRRQELMDAARDLFLQQGYEETSMADIARRADVAQGTFYLYFPSKQDVLAAILRQWFDQICAIVQETAARPDLSALEKLHSLMAEVIHRMKQENRLVQAVYLRSNVALPSQLVEEYNPVLMPALTAIIEQGVREGLMRVSNPRLAADFVWAVGYRYFERVAKQHLSGDAASLAELEQAFWEFTAQGLGVARPQATAT